MKVYHRILLIFSIIPASFLVSLLSFYYCAGSTLNRLPSPGSPDPKELGFYNLFAIFIDPAITIWIMFLPIWLISTIIILRIKRKEINLKTGAIVIIGFLLNFAAILLFLSEITSWYLD